MKHARSARGEVVDFDLLAIKQQLASRPVPVEVTQRRQFIDQKDGVRTKEVLAPELPSALDLAMQSALESAAAVDDVEAPVDQVVEEVAIEPEAPVAEAKPAKK